MNSQVIEAKNYVILTITVCLLSACALEKRTVSESDCNLPASLYEVVDLDPISEAQKSYEESNPKYLGVYGITLFVHGVSANPRCLISLGRLNVIEGRSDALCSHEHGRLVREAARYSKLFNEELTILPKGSLIGECGI